MNINKLTTKKFSGEVQEICQPFLQAHHLNYFDYARVYDDGSYMVLSSNIDVIENYITSKYPIAGTAFSNGIHPWTSFMPDKAIVTHQNCFDLQHGITFFNEHDGYTEFYDLAAPERNHHAYDFFFNQLDALNQFFFYFQEKAIKLIEQSHQQRLRLPKRLYGKPLTTFDQETDLQLNRS